MSSLSGKKILLAISGSIAAYKSAFLTRLLLKEGAEIKIILTSFAEKFITPLTLATLSKNPVLQDLIENEATGTWQNHVELGLWADLFIVAPATAHTLAQCANGLSDNLLVTTYLSARCPVFFAPAMDLDMYQHPSTKENLQRLLQFGNHIIPAEEGELASGLSGQGRMAEPEHILQYLKDFLQKASLQDFKGIHVLLTAGPTQESIDPVRFIGNHSSGKMGYALAEALAERGAKVFLVSGPTHLKISHPSIEKLEVYSAQQMYECCLEIFSKTQLTILAAAVADYAPKEVAAQKIKKKDNEMFIELVKTVDIAQNLGMQKKESQFMVGFALETNNELENAQSKLKRKNLDMIVLNSMQDQGAGFGHETNKITIIDKNGEILDFPMKSKKEVAKDIINRIAINIIQNISIP